MSQKDNARRTLAEVSFAGVDITDSIRPYLTSITFTDKEDGETDDLQLTLQDRENLWMQHWLTEAIEAASAAKLSIGAVFLRQNRNSDGSDTLLDCGTFELDSVTASGPPSTVTIKATSMPFSSQIRQTKKWKAWESYNLSGIANEMAGANGLTCMFESASDPFYERVEQAGLSDIAFLFTLCKNAGISLKVTSGIIVLFDQADYEKKGPISTIKYKGGGYLSYKLNAGSADTQYSSCRVSYVDPETGAAIEAVARIEDYNADAKNNQQLEIKAQVKNTDEARELAEKSLRLHNKFGKTASFKMVGDPMMLAGVTLELADFGAWSGKYIITQAKHSLGSGGYTTQIELRKVLEGY